MNGKSLADAPPEKDFFGMPKLTVKMAALLQGFPPDWIITGKKHRLTGRLVMPFLRRSLKRKFPQPARKELS